MFHKNTSEEINSNCPKAMQGMVANSAAHRVKKRRRKNVVEIYGHGSQKDEPVSSPVLFIIKPGNSAYGYKVKKVMGESLHLQISCIEVLE